MGAPRRAGDEAVSELINTSKPSLYGTDPRDQQIAELTRQRDDLKAALDVATLSGLVNPIELRKRENLLWESIQKTLAHEHFPDCRCSADLKNYCDERRLRLALAGEREPKL